MIEMNTKQFTEICKNALALAHETLKSLDSSGTLEVHDAHVTDISTKGDMAVSSALIEYFRQQNVPAVLLSEESGRIELVENPKYQIVFDDIDGTDNYFRGLGMLPYCTVVTIFDSTDPRFKDAIVAGVIEHNSGNIWSATRGEGSRFNGKKVQTSKKSELNRRTLVAVDHYACSDQIATLNRLYSMAWVKDFGSAAFQLAGVSSGLFDGYICLMQKSHEIGAGYLLITEAGGTIKDVKGNSLASVNYQFDTIYQVVAAATDELCDKLLSKIDL